MIILFTMSNKLKPIDDNTTFSGNMFNWVCLGSFEKHNTIDKNPKGNFVICPSHTRFNPSIGKKLKKGRPYGWI